METRQGIFKLRNYFTVIGLVSTLVAAILLALLYRHMAIGDIVTLGERNNLVLAETVLSSVEDELIDYLEKENIANRKDRTEPTPLPAPLNKAIQNVMANESVNKINIFNIEGKVVFSSKPSQIGEIEKDNLQFQSAIDGNLTSRLIYHDVFSFYRNASEDDNQVQSYLPIRSTPISAIHGVFEIYTDVQFIVDHVERTETLAFSSVFIILLILYSILATIVRTSANTIEQQHSIIQERTRTLELLSSQMLNAQEGEKKRMANTLHEGIAQTLAALKNNSELMHSQLIKKLDKNELQPLRQNIQALQDTIQEIRSMSMELRPPSLDDFGIIKTIQWLCSEYNSIYPNMDIRFTSSMDESLLPGSLKTLIYRVAQETLVSIGKAGMADNIHLDLAGTANSVSLCIEDNALPYHPDPLISIENASGKVFDVMKERTLLSGGIFTIEVMQGGGTLAKATWNF